ncbi:MAG TPA: preprotein translocase subunit SecE [Candidatus Staskawiczbacteria bacterium]|mgnify:CR=1 FL=1|nr:preprotein translocase subunit SecE [Candidatus Staskawiczbacteria bacterium]
MNFTEKIKAFFKEVFVEMKRVSWLSKKEIIKYTMIVIGFTFVAALFLGGLDYLFSFLLKRLITQ